MKDFKGSAGPWSAHDDEESMATSVVMNDFGDILCVVGTFMTSTEEDYANANLIAAAPDLLEALQEFVDLFPDVIDGDAIMPALDKGYAAIAKAIGEEE
ncbi:hypothetical protein ACM917_002316 [Cronobacter sakazakii]|uniref:hypothetical protein n=1 Tax=Cronobacter sakazakii TaxID=28141 RepID=UPI000CFDB511|nr:hypothetical protein [Cronobacter sakazakii]EGT4354718.1 hypothetical protein [Cronobacter sakazakii]ELQ6121981.1 hypothetical protein [Cronobacter sakazakii]ELQ6154299.1 hypothetical protein [Cronobacter sakazakii]ELQ6163260.1 hypothetical protein [Cronobacter sakazakii]ELY2791085.1 hypothetical protein [Cronobacter sakazakii]